MAFGVENTASTTGVSVGSLTFALTVTSANKLVVTVGTGSTGASSGQVLSATYNALALTQVVERNDAGWVHAELWHRTTPSVGTFNVIVNFDGSASQAAAGATGFIDADATLGTPNSNGASTTNPTLTVVDSVSGDIVVSVVCSDAGPLATMTPGGTQLWEAEDLGSDIDVNAQRQTASGASTVCSWTCSSAEPYVAVGVAVKSGAGSVPLTQIDVSEFPKQKLRAA